MTAAYWSGVLSQAAKPPRLDEFLPPARGQAEAAPARPSPDQLRQKAAAIYLQMNGGQG